MLSTMVSAGWTCCYVLFEGVAPDAVATSLGGRLDPRLRSERDASRPAAAWPSVGPAGGGWTAVIDPHFEFGDTDAELAKVSVGTRVVRLLGIEADGYRQVRAWAGGAPAWEASFERGGRAETGGGFPYDPAELAGPHGGSRVPEAAVRRLTGWSPGARPDDLRYCELIYPRPAAVAEFVHRSRVM